jgi:hypothetical protein
MRHLAWMPASEISGLVFPPRWHGTEGKSGATQSIKERIAFPSVIPKPLRLRLKRTQADEFPPGGIVSARCLRARPQLGAGGKTFSSDTVSSAGQARGRAVAGPGSRPWGHKGRPRTARPCRERERELFAVFSCQLPCRCHRTYPGRDNYCTSFRIHNTCKSP